MDDFAGVVEKVMSQPGAMEQLQSMAKQLGLAGDMGDAPAQPEEIPAEMAAKVMSALSEASKNDQVTDFLQALRQLMRPERQEKIDRAIRAVHLMRTARSMTKVVEP